MVHLLEYSRVFTGTEKFTLLGIFERVKEDDEQSLYKCELTNTT